MSALAIRRVRQDDLPVLTDIYNHYVTQTHVTFDVEPKTVAQRQTWFDLFGDRGRYQCFVATRDGAPIGWACSGKFREKPGYVTSVEPSIYLAPGAGGQGLGRRLYETLFAALAGEDVHRAYAGVCLPNDASVSLHKAMGFEHVGTYREVGRKFGRYWDVAWYARPMD